MKRLILVSLIAIPFLIQAQNFAPGGAEWHYDERFAFSGDINYIMFSAEKDTLIFGENCTKITKRHKLICNNRPEVEYVFTRNDTVFFLDTMFNKFQTLYDFNAQVNESWIILVKDENQEIDSITVTVDSISTLNVNNIDLKTLHVTYFKNDEFMPQTYTSLIVERFGDIQYMFNWNYQSQIVCDGNYSNGLRCYEDEDLGLYLNGIADSCDYTFIWTEIKENEEDFKFSVSPNPTTGIITILGLPKTDLKILITNLTGKVILFKSFKSEIQIDLSNYQNGIYLISLFRNNTRIGTKKIIKE